MTAKVFDIDRWFCGADSHSGTSNVNTNSTQQTPTLEEMERALKAIPPPPRYYARPDWCNHLRGELDRAHARLDARQPPQPLGLPASLTRCTHIEIVERAPYRWMIEYHDTRLVYLMDGRLYEIKRDWQSFNWEAARPRPIPAEGEESEE